MYKVYVGESTAYIWLYYGVSVGKVWGKYGESMGKVWGKGGLCGALVQDGYGVEE